MSYVVRGSGEGFGVYGSGCRVKSNGSTFRFGVWRLGFRGFVDSGANDISTQCMDLGWLCSTLISN